MKKLLKIGFAALTALAILGTGTKVHASEVQSNTETVWNLDALTHVAKRQETIAKTVKLFRETETTAGFKEAYFGGSGFYIEGGYVITAAHCITAPGNWTGFYVRDGHDGIRTDVEVIAVDAHRDLALLKTKDKDHPYFNVADTVSIGEAITLIGNSRDRAVENPDFVETTGELTISSYWTSIGQAGEAPLSQNYRMKGTITCYPGDSGGVVINGAGQVVGVAVATTRDGTDYAVMVKLQDLQEFIVENTPRTGHVVYE